MSISNIHDITLLLFNFFLFMRHCMLIRVCLFTSQPTQFHLCFMHKGI